MIGGFRRIDRSILLSTYPSIPRSVPSNTGTWRLEVAPRQVLRASRGEPRPYTMGGRMIHSLLLQVGRLSHAVTSRRWRSCGFGVVATLAKEHTPNSGILFASIALRAYTQCHFEQQKRLAPKLLPCGKTGPSS